MLEVLLEGFCDQVVEVDFVSIDVFGPSLSYK